MTRTSTLLLAALWIAGGVSAQESPGERVYSGVGGSMQIETPLRVGDVDVRIDGRIDEAVWEEAAVLTGFTQYNPNEGIPASQDTEARIFITPDAIYVAFRAFDDDPEGIIASMAQRDLLSRSDDYVRLVLDTFNDRRRAYVFSVNPYGVQQDGIWLEGGGGGGGMFGRRRGFGPPIDDNPNLIWESGGRLEDWGYSVEMRIPFKSLRFPKVPLQSWGVQLYRRIQRSGYEQSWGPSFARTVNKLTEAGRLLSLENLTPGRFLQINPVFTGSRNGELDGADVFNRENPEGEFGLNLTYGLTSNLTLDGTVNPDFSQVEADAGQIAVNERFALFFPEKRPFFLEGTEIFGLPQQLVFTRTIANPITGAKITGKVGGASLGYLGAIDEFEFEDDVLVNLLRYRQDVGGSSTIGTIYTDRTRSSVEYNRVVGLDGRFVIGQNTVTLQAAESWDRDLGEDQTSGGLLFAELARSGRHLSGTATFLDTQPDFRTESGFLRRTGEVAVNLSRVRYNWYGSPGSIIRRTGPFLEAQAFWNHDAFWAGDRWKEGQLRASWSTALKNNVTFWFNFSRSEFDFPDSSYEGLFTADPDGSLSPFIPEEGAFKGVYGFMASTFFSGMRAVQGRLTFQRQETPIFDVRTGSPVELADQWGGDVQITLRPTRSLRLDLGVRHAALNRKDGTEYSRATIPRIKAQYQFNRALFIRGIVEYASQVRGDLIDPATGLSLTHCKDGDCKLLDGSNANDIQIEGLISYEPSPGTLFFFGYTRRMEDTSRFGFRDVRSLQDGLFLKASYLFRL
jgi:uncharacterized protein DUF5916